MEKDVKKPRIYTNILTQGKDFLFGSRTRVIISTFIIAIFVYFSWQTFSQGKKQTQYQTATVSRGTIIASVTENGNVASGSQAGVGSPTTGVITDIFVKDGDSVTAGQNLFKVKSTATAQEIASSYANLLLAQNTVNTAKSKMNSLQAALFKANQAFITDKGIPNPSDQQKADPVYIQENANWLQAESDYNNQAGVISQAQAALNNASLSYQATQDSIVTAPITGTVANIAFKTGDQITASSGNLSSELTGSATNSNTPVLSIGNFSNPYVKVQASEVDIPSIKTGQKATITLDAFPGKTYVGTVDQVDSVGTVASGVVTYNVFATIVSPPSDMKPGMSAVVTIQTARKDNALSVPTSAVQTVGGQATVRVLQNGQLTSVPVEVGIASDTQTEVTSGLSEGDTVVTGVIPASPQGTSASPFGGIRGFGGGGGGGAIRGGRGG